MIVAGQRLPIVIATKPVDFRRGHDGLAATVQNELGLDPHSGLTVVFRSKRGDRMKILVWDGTGLVLIYKRLEVSNFVWPKIQGGVMQLSRAQYEALFEGLDWQQMVPKKVAPPVAALKAMPGGVVAVGLEAGPLSQWLYRYLTDAGFAAVLMETRQVKGALKAMPIKTDRRDAEGIARLLQMGWYRPVHCKSVSAQEMRALLSARKAIQQAAINLELSIRGVLRNFGLKMGRVAKGRFEARVQELTEGNPMLEAAANPILATRRTLRQELAGLEKALRDHVKEDPACRTLMTMPGVGPGVALTVKAAIDDPARFRSSKDIGPWVGLTPRREQSGERDIVGQISRAGDVGLRTALYQAATTMMHRGRKNWLTAWAMNVAKRRGKKRATVALARRIGVVLHRMWTDGTDFRFTRKDAAAAAAA